MQFIGLNLPYGKTPAELISLYIPEHITTWLYTYVVPSVLSNMVQQQSTFTFTFHFHMVPGVGEPGFLFTTSSGFLLLMSMLLNKSMIQHDLNSLPGMSDFLIVFLICILFYNELPSNSIWQQWMKFSQPRIITQVIVFLPLSYFFRQSNMIT